MLRVIFHTIPTGVNEFIFVIGIVGFVLLLFLKKRNNRVFQACIIAVLLMFAWRIAITIESARYSIVLIYLFALVTARQLYYFLKSNVIYIRAFAVLLICCCLYFFSDNISRFFGRSHLFCCFCCCFT